jgi:hypothetical protein
MYERSKVVHLTMLQNALAKIKADTKFPRDAEATLLYVLIQVGGELRLRCVPCLDLLLYQVYFIY